MKRHSLSSFTDLETLYEQRLLDMLKAQGGGSVIQTVCSGIRSTWDPEQLGSGALGFRPNPFPAHG